MKAYDFESTSSITFAYDSSLTMASASVSSSAAPERMSFELACRDWTMEKHSTVLEDKHIEEAQGQSVSAGSTLAVPAGKLNAPVWLQRAYDKINGDLQSMATVIQKLLDECQDRNHVAPGIVATCHTLLTHLNFLFEQQSEELQSALRLDYVQFEAASTQFAQDSRMALVYISKSVTDRAIQVGKEALQNLNYLAVHNTKQFEKVEMWAKQEEWTRSRLERKVEEEKERSKVEMDSLRRNIAAWKDQEEKMSKFRMEAVKERRLIQARAHRLEKEALALSEEVQTTMKRGKTLLLVELNGIQNLLKKTVKTAKSTAMRGEPEETPAPPFEITAPLPTSPLSPPPPLPLPPLPLPGKAVGTPEPPQPPPKLTAQGLDPGKHKEKEGGPPRKPPRGDGAAEASDPDDRLSSSSISSDSDNTGVGTIESLLRHCRQE